MKSVSTNNLYQSTFMPIFQEAEKKIKQVILLCFLLYLTMPVLMNKVSEIIRDTVKKIPEDLPDRESYINGLNRKTQILITIYYSKPKARYESLKTSIYNLIDERPDISSPSELASYIESNRETLNMWAERKGVPYIRDYPKELKLRLNKLANEELTTSESGKKPITLWQKAELDLRHEKQMSMVQDLIDSGVEYAWISSHPNCSKRCEKWQGKLVSLTKHATMPNFRVERLDGIWVYSLPDIMSQVDKYGYQNNIINGFNCRHHLTPYKKGTVAPTRYSKEEIATQRAIEQRIRELEREIRKLHSKLSLLEIQLKVYNKSNKTIAKSIKTEITNLKDEIKYLTAYYKKFCEVNGYAWYDYRIQ